MKYLLDVRRFKERFFHLVYLDTDIGELQIKPYFDFKPRFYIDKLPTNVKKIADNLWSLHVGKIKVEREYKGVIKIKEFDAGTLHYRKVIKNNLITLEEIPLYQVDCNVSWDVPDISRLHEKSGKRVYENDIPYEQVFINDKNLRLVSQKDNIIDVIKDAYKLTEKLRSKAFDLEWFVKKKGHNPNELCAAVFRSNDKIKSYTVGVNCVNETELLLKCYNEIKRAHIIYGWFSNYADIPVFISRIEHHIKRLKLKTTELSEELEDGRYLIGYKDIQEERSRLIRQTKLLTNFRWYFRKRRAKKSFKEEFFFDLKKGFHVDFYHLIKGQIIVKQNFENYKLDTVVKDLFGFVHTLKQRQQMVDDLTPQEIDEYVRMDGDATYQFEKFIPFLLIYSYLTSVPISRIGETSAGMLADGFLITTLKRKYGNIIISRLKRRLVGLRIQGAIVRDAIGGIHENVSCIDFSSMYPTIDKNENISFETVDCGHEECKDNVIHITEFHKPRKATDKKAKVREKREDLFFKYSINVVVCTKKRGILSELIEELINLSENIKAFQREVKKEHGVNSEMYKTVDEAYKGFKALRNIVGYGYMLAPLSRYGSEIAGRLILHYARKYLNNAADIIDEDMFRLRKYGVLASIEQYSYNEKVIVNRKEGLTKYGMNVEVSELSSVKLNYIKKLTRVVYGDTDSCFVKNLQDDELKKIQDVTGIPLDIEATGTFIQKPNTKKKYILITHDGSAKIRGIKMRRKDTPVFIRQAQIKFVGLLMKTNNYNEVLESIELIKEKTNNIIRNIQKLNPSFFKISKTANDIKVNQPQKVTIDMLMANGYDYAYGDKVSWVYIYQVKRLKTKDKLVRGTMPFDMFDTNKHIIHFQHYIMKFLEGQHDLYGTTEKKYLVTMSLDENQVIKYLLKTGQVKL